VEASLSHGTDTTMWPSLKLCPPLVLTYSRARGPILLSCSTYIVEYRGRAAKYN